MYCGHCGSKLSGSARFCGKCGQPVQDTAAPNVDPSQRQPPIDPTPVQPPRPAPQKNNSKILAVVAAIAVIAVVVVAVFAFLPKGTDSSNSQSRGSAGTAVGGKVPAVVDPKTGTEIKAIERPMLIAATTAQDAEKTAVAQPKATSVTVEPGLANVINANSTTMSLSDETKSLIEKYGFAVQGDWGNDEFFEVYETNRYAKNPNFVTTDSLMHTYHLYFQHLQKNTELDHLSAAVLRMSHELLDTSVEQLEALKGTEWESAAKRNVAFFAVGASLQDPSTQVPAEVESMVSAELASIQQASGIATSAITGDEEDYSQYIVRGYYEGNETLERYFRTMMWYGRLNFKQSDEDLDRSALLMTMALKGSALEAWEAVYTVTSFFAGASDDCGYYEYQPLFTAAYGKEATESNLAGNDEAWEHYHTLTAGMPAPQINSVPLGEGDSADQSRTEAEKGYRLMGQRFTLDEMIFTQLVTPEVKENSSGQRRTMPDALDVPTALGSDDALQIMESRGATDYAGYSENVQKLRSSLTNEEDPRWQASLYSQWLYTINPLLVPKGDGYPTFMQSSQWTRKSLQSYLGSYTELKHDTVLYAKQIMAEGGGGPNDVVDDRGYVEPEPVVFTRLATLTQRTRDGLAGYGLLNTEDEENLTLLSQLSEKLATIAHKELEAETPTDEEFELIRSYGEQLEHFWQEVYKEEAGKEYFTSREFPCAIVADIATDGDSGQVLEVGTGKAKTIYVAVEVEGKVRIATGSVFSFYEFTQPMSDRLTDTKWRQMMGIEPGEDGRIVQQPSQELQDWTDDFTYYRR